MTPPRCWWVLAVLTVGCQREPLNVVVDGRCRPSTTDAAMAPPLATAASLRDSFGIGMDLPRVLERDPSGRPVLERLGELGIRHVHSGELGADQRNAAIERVIREDVRPLWLLRKNGDPAAFLRAWADLTPAIALPDPEDVTSNSTFKWPQALDKAKAIIAAVDAGPSAGATEIVGFRVSSEGDSAALGDLSELVDYGGVRSTTGSSPPRASFGSWLDLQRAIAARRPLVTTSMFYRGLPPADATSPADTELVQAKYVLRMLLGSFKRGIIRSYYSHFADQNCQDCSSGLLRIDGSAKPAYRAWQAAADVLLPEPGAPMAEPPAAFPFTVEASPTELSDFESLVVSRSDGALVLFLWLELTSTDNDVSRQVIVHPGLPLSRATLASMRGPAPSEALDAERPLAVSVTDLPIALVLHPRCR